jgi:hypothetical protein
MGWLSGGWKYRVPVAVNNSVPAALVDVSIPIPEDWDLFWDTIDASGIELRITKADGITATVYQLGAAPAFNRTNKVGRIEVDDLLADVGAASVMLCWLYFGNTGAVTGAGTFVAAAAVIGYIHTARPRGYVLQGRPHVPGSTRPPERVQKGSTEEVFVWFELRGMLELRPTESSDALVWEEVWQVTSRVDLAGAARAEMITQDRTRFVEMQGDGRLLFFVGLYVKAGTSPNNYTLRPLIETFAPETAESSGAMVQSAYRVLEPRALLSIYDVSEV